MYHIIFYRKNDRAKSDTEDFIETNRMSKAHLDQVLWNTIVRYLHTLGEGGTRIGEPFVKHLDDGIWELRPSNYRILFFYWKENTYVLLNYFLKKTNKTPDTELERAKRYRTDWRNRKGD